jgi:hypothetical protein
MDDFKKGRVVALALRAKIGPQGRLYRSRTKFGALKQAGAPASTY